MAYRIKDLSDIYLYEYFFNYFDGIEKTITNPARNNMLRPLLNVFTQVLNEIAGRDKLNCFLDNTFKNSHRHEKLVLFLENKKFFLELCKNLNIDNHSLFEKNITKLLATDYFHEGQQSDNKEIYYDSEEEEIKVLEFDIREDKEPPCSCLKKRGRAGSFEHKAFGCPEKIK